MPTFSKILLFMVEDTEKAIRTFLLNNFTLNPEVCSNFFRGPFLSYNKLTLFEIETIKRMYVYVSLFLQAISVTIRARELRLAHYSLTFLLRVYVGRHHCFSIVLYFQALCLLFQKLYIFFRFQ